MRVGSLFLCFSILLQKRYRLLGDGCLMLFRTFFIAFSAARQVFPSEFFLCKVSCWRFKPVYEPGLTKAKGSSRFTKPLPFVNTEPHTCLPLPAHFEAQEKSKGNTEL